MALSSMDLMSEMATFGLQVVESIDLKPANDFKQFLFGEDYLALPESEIYPGVVEVGSEIYDGFINNRYDHVFVLAGLGSGKSTMASLLACAIAHWLLCLRDPHKHFGLLPDKPLVIPCMGPTATQVRDVVFASIKSFLENGPFFQRCKATIKIEPELVDGQTAQRTLTIRATFTRKIDGRNRKLVEILAGNSVENYPLGMNVFAAIVDELSKFRDSEGKSQAKQIFETLDQRRLSRFGGAKQDGFIMCIGTAGAEGDYVDRRLKEADADARAYVKRGRTWEMRGRSRYPGDTFHFVKRDMGPKGINYECLDAPPNYDDVVLHLSDVPDVFREVFRRDPVLALRDFASISSLALFPFDVNAEAVSRLVNLDREHPLYPSTLEPKEWFRGEPGINYYIHADLGLNREGRGDAAGFAMAHTIGEKRVKVGVGKEEGGDWEGRFEFRPIVYVDLILRWTAGERGEILFSEIREFIYRLLELGFDISGQPMQWDRWGNPKPGEIIGGCSYDGWQSTDSVQILREHGIAAQVFSVDRMAGPYEDLREAIHDARLDFYDYQIELDGLPISIFQHEYRRLERIKRSGSNYKVDHPEGGSKDVSDAIAAVVSRITIDHKRASGGWA